MWQDKLKEIIYILENSNVNEIEISFWGRKYRVSKQANVVVQENLGAGTPTTTIQNLQQERLDNIEPIDAEEPGELDSNDGEGLLSPMPGTFYITPTPDDDPFVSKGDSVKKGQTLCIIEAMKMMNEIESEFDGTIIDIKVDNGQPVEYNQPLFLIKPS